MIICPSFFNGRFDGIGRVSKEVSLAFEGLGHQPQILSANDPEELCLSKTSFGYGRNYSKMLLSSLIQSFHPPKLIVCMHLGLAPVARIVSRRYGVPYLIFLHGIEAWETLNFRRRWGLTKARQFISNSNFTLRHFKSCTPSFSHIPADVVPLGIGIDLEEVLDLDRKPQILIVGRLDQGEQYKGHRLLISCLDLIAKEYPEVFLTIVGDGDDRKNLEHYANQFSHREKIKFLGKVSDSELSKLYLESMVFAMPSMGEGFGLVYLEAMAHGLPCICSDVDAAREVVVHEETGFVVDPSNPFDLAERILQLLRHPELRFRMGNAGKARYLTYFSQMVFQTRLQEVLNSHWCQ
ncbi:MAG: glycosyltransferase family 4 protein [SAR324 cluster bacterium]|nr:glycosyltransferase family 4 protein [SAR324 cluster bacterium]